MVLTISLPVKKFSRSHCLNKPISNYTPIQTSNTQKFGIKYAQQKQGNLCESLLGACAGQLIFCNIAQASAAFAVESQQGNSLPYVLVFGAVLVAGTLNGIFSVMKTAVDKTSEKELLEKALNRHQTFVGQSQEQQNQISQTSENNNGNLQKWQIINKLENRSESAHSLTAGFQQGLGKSGRVIQQQKQQKKQQVLSRAYVTASEASKPRRKFEWNEDRTVAAHVLRTQFSKTFGKSIFSSWSPKIFGGEEAFFGGRAYAVETKASEPIALTLAEEIREIISEDRSVAAHVMRTAFGATLGKVGSVSYSPEKVLKSDKVLRAYAVDTQPSKLVTLEQLTEEEAQPLKKEQQSKNPIVWLFEAIFNFFKWLLSLIFGGGGGSSSSKPATA